MSVIPRSLCAVDGSLYIPTNKASFLHAIESVKYVSPLQSHDIPNVSKYTTKVVTGYHWCNGDITGNEDNNSYNKAVSPQGCFCGTYCIASMIPTGSYDEGRIVFDRYMEESLKNKTRQKRAATSDDYQINQVMRLCMSIRKLLSSSYTKSCLTAIFPNALLEHYSSITTVKLVVV